MIILKRKAHTLPLAMPLATVLLITNVSAEEVQSESLNAKIAEAVQNGVVVDSSETKTFSSEEEAKEFLAEQEATLTNIIEKQKELNNSVAVATQHALGEGVKVTESTNTVSASDDELLPKR